ncbi:MAG: holo-ACP synthase [Magnetococcales bacterium]|nr:holo-ACP synthase [Magnetococcales bacterium]
MIQGIGTDIVAVERIRQATERWGEKFLHRIYTASEISHCQTMQNPSPCLAKRFAAKEALVKALGTGMRDGIWFTDIQVSNNASGKPSIKLHGTACRYLEAMGGGTIHLSLSDDDGRAMAFVVIEKTE